MVEEIQQAIQKKLEEAETELKQGREFVTEIDNLFLKDYFTYCKPQKIAEIVVHGNDLFCIVFKHYIYHFQLWRLVDLPRRI